MNTAHWFYMTIMIIGSGLFCSAVFPCFNGPFDILKRLRDNVGKPFSCPTCSLLWGIVISSILSLFIPMFIYLILGSAGWGVLIIHIVGWQPIYQGMED